MIKQWQQFETTDSRKIQDWRRVGDNDQSVSVWRSRPKVLAEFLYSVMDRKLAFSQQSLKGELAQFRKTAGLRQSKPLLL